MDDYYLTKSKIDKQNASKIVPVNQSKQFL